MNREEVAQHILGLIFSSVAWSILGAPPCSPATCTECSTSRTRGCLRGWWRSLTPCSLFALERGCAQAPAPCGQPLDYLPPGRWAHKKGKEREKETKKERGREFRKNGRYFLSEAAVRLAEGFAVPWTTSKL